MPPAATPTFFVDRSLGRNLVPQGLRRAGWDVVTLAEHYGFPREAAVGDEEWLALSGQRGWAVLMKDERIRYRSTERKALLDAKIQAFCLSAGNLRSEDMLQLLLIHQSAIWTRAATTGPGFHVLTRSGLRRVALDE